MDDHYEVLGLLPRVEAEVIEAAYKRLARKYHPDTNAAVDAESRMKRINAAYEVLKDPQQRAAYDRGRAQSASHGAQTTPEPSVREAAAATGAIRGLTSILAAKGVPVVDKRAAGGALWIVDAPGVKAVVDSLKRDGYTIEYATAGGRAVEYQPAWWTKDSD